MCGVAEVEAREPLGDDDRVAAVRGEVHVVRVVDRDRAARAAGSRVDRSQAVADVVGDVERSQVPRRDDVLGQQPDREVLDDLERARVDHVDGVALGVRDVDEWARKPRRAPSGDRRRRPRRRRPPVPARARRDGGDPRVGSAVSSVTLATVPCASRPPATTTRRPSATAARSLSGAGSRPASRVRPPGRSTATILSVGVPVGHPGLRSRTLCRPMPAAAACVVGAGNEPTLRTRAGRGSNATTALPAVPVGSEPPAITSLPSAVATAA